MKVNRRNHLFILGILFLLVSFSCKSQKIEGLRDCLKVDIRFDQDTIKRGDSLCMEVTFQNISELLVLLNPKPQINIWHYPRPEVFINYETMEYALIVLNEIDTSKKIKNDDFIKMMPGDTHILYFPFKADSLFWNHRYKSIRVVIVNPALILNIDQNTDTNEMTKYHIPVFVDDIPIIVKY